MTVRLAGMADLPSIQAMYAGIIRQMERDGLSIWDEVYPNDFFAEDIERQRLYVLERDGAVAGAFALCGTSAGAACGAWEDAGASALYLDRLGVSAEHARQGLGSFLLRSAAALAKERGADYLRLFVVDSNRPAIGLYRKNGFRQTAGVYSEVIDADLTLREFCFELKLDACSRPSAAY